MGVFVPSSAYGKVPQWVVFENAKIEQKQFFCSVIQKEIEKEGSVIYCFWHL